MSEAVCQAEHAGSIKYDNNSFNQNDINGEELAQQTVIAFITMMFAFLCFLVAICVHNRPIRLIFILITCALLAVFITFTTKAAIKASKDPIMIAFSLSHFVTKSVRTSPLLNPDSVFPEHVEFEAEFENIRREVMEVAKQEELWPLAKRTYQGANSTISDITTVDGKEVGWRFLSVSVGGKFGPQIEQMLPALTSLVKKHGDKIMTCAISMLPPHVKITPHIGYSKSIIRYFLPIELPTQPNACFLCLNGAAHGWQLGKSFCFDDCFTHSVHNDSDQRRIVVFMDIVREIHGKPLLSKITKFMFKHFVHKTKAVQDELKKTEVLVPTL